MGYKIEYDSRGGKYEIRKHTSGHPAAFTAAAIAALMLFTWTFWPEGKEFLLEVLIPGDESVTMQALEDLAKGLRNGTSLLDAVTTFCNHVIHAAANSY